MLLREHVFIHVERPLDKLNALIAMTGKLFALVADLCGEDNADALSHHEVLLPGTLLSKFVSDKLAECLAVFKRQVSCLEHLGSMFHIELDIKCLVHSKRLLVKVELVNSSFSYLSRPWHSSCTGQAFQWWSPRQHTVSIINALLLSDHHSVLKVMLGAALSRCSKTMTNTQRRWTLTTLATLRRLQIACQTLAARCIPPLVQSCCCN